MKTLLFDAIISKETSHNSHSARLASHITETDIQGRRNRQSERLSLLSHGISSAVTDLSTRNKSIQHPSTKTPSFPTTIRTNPLMDSNSTAILHSKRRSPSRHPNDHSRRRSS